MSWKTIEQRERSTASARRTQRRGQAAVTTGGLLAGGAYLRGAGPNGNLGDYGRNAAVGQSRDVVASARRLAGNPALTFKDRAKLGGRLIQRKPLGAALVGGGALAGVGGLGMLQGASREAYHQTRINARRKDNARRVSASKADRRKSSGDPSGGRMALGAAFGPFHGLVAGQGKGGKAKSAGTQVAGTMAGSALGSRGGIVGSTVGGLAGGALTTRLANQRGWLKREKKVTAKKSFATRDENSSIGTTITWKMPQGDHRKGTLKAKERGAAGGSQRRPFASKDENSSVGTTRVRTPRGPSGKFVSHEADLKVFSPIGRKGKRRTDPPQGLERFTNSGRGQARLGRGTPIKKSDVGIGTALLGQRNGHGKRLR